MKMLVFIFAMSVLGLVTTVFAIFEYETEFLGTHCILLVMFTGCAMISAREHDRARAEKREQQAKASQENWYKERD